MDTNKNQQTQTPAKELKLLEIFVGKWKIIGKNFSAAPNSPETPVSGEDNYAWLHGNFFLINNWQHLFDGDGHKGLSVLGFDPKEKKLFTRNFDNLGFERKYILEQENNSWKFIGSKERAVRKFSDDGNSYVEHWEILTDNDKWSPLCVMNGTKI